MQTIFNIKVSLTDVINRILQHVNSNLCFIACETSPLAIPSSRETSAFLISKNYMQPYVE